MASKPKKQQKMTRTQKNEILWKMGLKPIPTRAQIRAAWKAKAKAESKEKRQEILDMIRANCHPDAIAQHAGVDVDTVYGVLYLNRYSVQLLREVTL